MSTLKKCVLVFGVLAMGYAFAGTAAAHKAEQSAGVLAERNAMLAAALHGE